MKDYNFKNLQNAEHLGFDSQSDQLYEECSELIQAVNKYKRVAVRGNGTGFEEWCHVIEEIGDVEVMLEQIKHLLGINQVYVEQVKKQKIFKTAEDIKRGVYDTQEERKQVE